MLQSILTLTIEAIVSVSAFYFTVGLVLSLGSKFMTRHHIAPGQLSLFDDVLLSDAELEQLQPEPQPAAPKFTHAIVPFHRPIKLETMSIRQLKAIASKVKLPRYNVEPKQRLADRLMAEVERSVLVAAL